MNGFENDLNKAIADINSAIGQRDSAGDARKPETDNNSSGKTSIAGRIDPGLKAALGGLAVIIALIFLANVAATISAVITTPSLFKISTLTNQSGEFVNVQSIVDEKVTINTFTVNKNPKCYRPLDIQDAKDRLASQNDRDVASVLNAGFALGKAMASVGTVTKLPVTLNYGEVVTFRSDCGGIIRVDLDTDRGHDSYEMLHDR
jgi:hypothetical protein